MRRLLVLAMFAGAVVYGAPVASACHLTNPHLWWCWFVHFSGSATVDCFGCGTSHGEADLTFTALGSGHADFTANEPGGSLCLVTGTANGHVSGDAGEFDFNWTRVGATAVFTTSGDRTGAGVAAFVASGVTCGAAMSATVTGVLVG